MKQWEYFLVIAHGTGILCTTAQDMPKHGNS